MTPSIERTDPPYLQIARTIRDDIESGRLPEGSAVPSAREIVSTWGVALATATKVQAQLRSEGLIRSVPGVGSVVTARETAIGGLQRLEATRARGHVYGVNERAVIRSSELVVAPDLVADALGIVAGSPVIRRERVIGRDGAAGSLSVSWLPGQHIDIAPRLLKTERIREGTFAYLAAAVGLTVTACREQTSAGAADRAQAAALGVDAGSSVLLTRIWYFANDGTPIEYGEAVHPAGRWLSHEFALG